jgi:hypothetical protein
MLLTQYKATSFTSIYKQANYIYVYINFLCIFDNNMKKYMYWKNGDEVEDKLQRHLFAVTA